MKNLIVTFQNELNYGAVLQAYALKQFMSGFSETNVCDLGFKLNDEPIVNRLYSLPKNIKFKKFQKHYLNLSGKVMDVRDLEKLVKDYDRVIVGSDQVFAIDLVEKYKKLFFLDFLHDGKYSYAASFGDNENIVNNLPALERYFKTFKKVSVREKSSSVILTKNGMKNEQCVDPTLLLTAKDYVNLFSLKKKDDSYILVYAPSMDADAVAAALKLRKETGMKIICFNVRNRFGRGTKCHPNASPVEFLEYFYNASIVVTNSFHGTCFSIVFRKPFVAVLSKKKEIRQKELLSEFKMAERIYSADTDIRKYLKKPKFDNYEDNILIHRSKKYLLDIAKEKK